MCRAKLDSLIGLGMHWLVMAGACRGDHAQGEAACIAHQETSHFLGVGQGMPSLMGSTPTESPGHN